MSLSWKVILPIIVLIIGVGAVVKYKNNSKSATEKTKMEQQMPEEKHSYDQKSPPLTEVEINSFVKAASVESVTGTEEEKDGVLLKEDDEALNGFSNMDL